MDDDLDLDEEPEAGMVFENQQLHLWDEQFPEADTRSDAEKAGLPAQEPFWISQEMMQAILTQGFIYNYSRLEARLDRQIDWRF